MNIMIGVGLAVSAMAIGCTIFTCIYTLKDSTSDLYYPEAKAFTPKKDMQQS